MQQPFVLRFKSVITREGGDAFIDTDARYDTKAMMWLDGASEPLWANRASKPYTPCHTAAHTIKGGYTPSGKYKPPKTVPGKTDKRSGK